MTNKSLSLLLALAVSLTLSMGGAASAGEPTSEQITATIPLWPNDHHTPERVKIMRRAGVMILDACPGLKANLSDIKKKTINLVVLGDSGFASGGLKSRGLLAQVSIEWLGPKWSEFVALEQGADGTPSGLRAYGAEAQKWCGMPTKPINQFIPVQGVDFLAK
ncbi:MAG: hypothetical protein CMM61_12905 [Rhodospirillaceae bacterium]|nr:hypothetical protein [Rhodospirillaceae bacterium]